MGGDSALAQHYFNLNTKFNEDVPYEIKVTSIEYLKSNLDSVGTGTKSKYGSLDTCDFNTNLEISGNWIVKIENNSNIDLAILENSDKYTALKAHSTINYIVYNNIYASASYLLYNYYANKWFYYQDYYGHVTDKYNRLTKSINFEYEKNSTWEDVPMSFYLKMDNACNIVEFQHSFSGGSSQYTTTIANGNEYIIKGTIKKSRLTANATFLHDLGLE